MTITNSAQTDWGESRERFDKAAGRLLAAAGTRGIPFDDRLRSDLEAALKAAMAQGAREANDWIRDRAAAMFDEGEITLEDRMTIDDLLDEEAAR
jgi:hypothetical protein